MSARSNGQHKSLLLLSVINVMGSFCNGGISLRKQPHHFYVTALIFPQKNKVFPQKINAAYITVSRMDIGRAYGDRTHDKRIKSPYKIFSILLAFKAISVHQNHALNAIYTH